MKLLLVCISLSVLLTGCANKQEKAAVNNSQTPMATPEVKMQTATPTPTATPAPAMKDDARPVDFTFLGITPGKQQIRYKIKVNTSKPISQVDLATKYMDANGKVLDETTIIWQNIVHSTRQPIEKGKTYEDDSYLPPGATKVECVLKRVVFEDHSVWNVEEP